MDEEFTEKKKLLQELVDLEVEGAMIVEEKKKKAKDNKVVVKKLKKMPDL